MKFKSIKDIIDESVEKLTHLTDDSMYSFEISGTYFYDGHLYCKKCKGCIECGECSCDITSIKIKINMRAYEAKK